jgi:2-oxoglutarate dehydrogenase E2 component (dihydrolipoamide succinyltransferase)
MIEVRVPMLGESVTKATIGRWFKKPGEAVAVNEPLVELETDKVTVEVQAPAAGVLSEVAVRDGRTVAVGSLLGQIREGAGDTSAAEIPPAPSVSSMPGATLVRKKRMSWLKSVFRRWANR